ncbi:YebC/PmpR family DNA-binding transcriptional regulator [Gallicola sp. Sow4_E12]|uniref:YebC/PmpR family DNA-binding transcriptional regulator n=1 Tax=Gallicola sp. Sow4_E12 TaxID=3438785 RepID=UPI003F905498
MSGHNKWSSIKDKKGKEDAKRGKIFTKIARMISVAVREGGPDPDYNPSLKSAIEKAKAENMPNDNIQRAIKKGSGEDSGASYEKIIYEGYGPEGVAVIVNCLTDNRNRTAADIRHAFDKFGGNLGQNGSVIFMFDHKGVLTIDKKDKDEEEFMLEAIEAGAEDVQMEEDLFVVTTSMDDFAKVRDNLLENGYEFHTADLFYLPQNETDVEDPEAQKKLQKMIDMLEDNDDVQSVFHNWQNADLENE